MKKGLGIRNWGLEILSSTFSRRVHAARSGRDRQISNPQSLIPNPSRAAFTLVEMLVTVAIIGILAAMTFGVLQLARETAREAATKATIAKLHTIIMRRYESYVTRRVPVRLVYPPSHARAGQPLSPNDAAVDRLYALRDIMRMEMPDRDYDINDVPITLPISQQQVARPALNQLYYNRLTNYPPMVDGVPQIDGKNGAAELLYMIISMGSPEAMEQFNQSEIGDTDRNGYLEFIDGWGRPIFFLRWAPGFSLYSDIQVKDPDSNHDPFDTRRVDGLAWHLIPLIYSDGSNSDAAYSLHIQEDYHFGNPSSSGEMFENSVFRTIGSPAGGATSYGGITNHHIEQR